MISGLITWFLITNGGGSSLETLFLLFLNPLFRVGAPLDLSFPCQDAYWSSLAGVGALWDPRSMLHVCDVLFVQVLLWQPHSRDFISVASLTLLGDTIYLTASFLSPGSYHLSTRCSLSLGSRNCVAQVSGGVGHPGSLVLCILTNCGFLRWSVTKQSFSEEGWEWKDKSLE